MLAQWPAACPLDWLARVRRAPSKREEEALRRAIDRGQPFDSAALVALPSGLAWNQASARVAVCAMRKVECPLFFPSRFLSFARVFSRVLAAGFQIVHAFRQFSAGHLGCRSAARSAVQPKSPTSMRGL
jgi:hypothetical protein